MRIHLRRIALSVFLLNGACHRSPIEEVVPPRWATVGHRCSKNAPASELSALRRDSLPRDADSLLDEDARWARIARSVPGGWGGGLFLDQGVPTMYLTDTSRRAEAVAALNRLGVDGRTIGPDVHIRQGRWTIAQLYDWYRYLNAHIRLESLTGSDVDQGANRLVYAVTTKTAVKVFEAQLIALGIPCFLVAIEVHPRARVSSTA
jgi:hypothetical protein